MIEKNYHVYFEVFGKKMKATVVAKNETEAKQKIKEKIIFYKVEEVDFLKKFEKEITDILNHFK